MKFPISPLHVHLPHYFRQCDFALLTTDPVFPNGGGHAKYLPSLNLCYTLMPALG